MEKEKDPGVVALVDSINKTKNPQKTLAILRAILMAVKECNDMKKGCDPN